MIALSRTSLALVVTNGVGHQPLRATGLITLHLEQVAHAPPRQCTALTEGSRREGIDIWSIQVRCARRIGEVVKLRFDCVSEHLGRPWMRAAGLLPQ